VKRHDLADSSQQPFNSNLLVCIAVCARLKTKREQAVLSYSRIRNPAFSSSAPAEGASTSCRQPTAINHLSAAEKTHYVDHLLRERNHQGMDNRLLIPGREVGEKAGEVMCCERLGGLLR